MIHQQCPLTVERRRMSQRMKRNADFIKALHSCSKSDQKTLLKRAKPDLINAICDCITNVVYGKVPISPQMKAQLRKKKKVLKELTDSKVPTVRKKSLLVQHGGSIILKALGGIANLLLGL